MIREVGNITNLFESSIAYVLGSRVGNSLYENCLDSLVPGVTGSIDSRRVGWLIILKRLVLGNRNAFSNDWPKCCRAEFIVPRFSDIDRRGIDFLFHGHTKAQCRLRQSLDLDFWAGMGQEFRDSETSTMRRNSDGGMCM